MSEPADRRSAKAEQRRGARYPVVVPVEAKWQEASGKNVKEKVQAREVNALGGLLDMKTCPSIGSQLELTNLLSGESFRARVIGARRSRDGSMLGVAVELLVPSETFWGVNFQLKKASDELLRLEQLMKSGNVEPVILKEFRDSVDYVRKTAWAVQEWQERELQQHDPHTLLPLITSERIRRTTQLSKSILADFGAHQVTRETAGIEEFSRAIDALHEYVAKLLGEREG